MTKDQAMQYVSNALRDIVEEKGETLGEVDEDSILLGSDIPIDSLDLATMVVQLEILTGHDPFSEGFIEFRTLGELAGLYAN